MSRWTVRDLPNLSGKTLVITGANTGVGFECAKAFVARGAEVILGCRDEGKAQDALARLRAATPSANVEAIPLDLASLASVRAFAQTVLQRHPRLDVLVNNAGVMALPARRTADGFEMQIGTNHLGPFALTAQLLPGLVASGAGRVVTVSSILHKRARLDLDDLNADKRYDKWAAYGQSKLANLLFTSELQRRLARAGAPVLAVAAHPGFSATDLHLVGPRLEGNGLAERFSRVMNALVAQPAERGAWPIEYAAAMADVKGGEYLGPDGFNDLRGYPTRARSSKAASDAASAKALWELSERLTGVRFDLTEA